MLRTFYRVIMLILCIVSASNSNYFSAQNEDLLETQFFEYTVPEYDLTERELYAKLIETSIRLDGKISENEYVELLFWSKDSVDLYGVLIGGCRDGIPRLPVLSEGQLTGYGYINDMLIYIKNSNNTKLKLKKPYREKTFKFVKEYRGFYDPMLYIYQKEGKNARYINRMIV